MIDCSLDDEFIIDSLYDSKLRVHWKYITKRIFSRIFKQDVNALYVAKWTTPEGNDKLVIGDADNTFRCSWIFSFGHSHLPHVLSLRLPNGHHMVNASELDNLCQQLIVNEFFYSGHPITVIKNRFGPNGKVFEVSSISTAIELVGLNIEALLVEADYFYIEN